MVGVQLYLLPVLVPLDDGLGLALRFAVERDRIILGDDRIARVFDYSWRAILCCKNEPKENFGILVKGEI